MQEGLFPPRSHSYTECIVFPVTFQSNWDLASLRAAILMSCHSRELALRHAMRVSASVGGSFDVMMPAPLEATVGILHSGVITAGSPIDRASSTATLRPSEYDGRQKYLAAESAANLVCPLIIPMIVTVLSRF